VALDLTLLIAVALCAVALLTSIALLVAVALVAVALCAVALLASIPQTQLSSLGTERSSSRLSQRMQGLGLQVAELGLRSRGPALPVDLGYSPSALVRSVLRSHGSFDAIRQCMFP
jgi:hypothetical protein